MSVTVRQTGVGFLILFVVTLLVLAAAFYWYRITGVSPLHFLADIPDHIIQGC